MKTNLHIKLNAKSAIYQVKYTSLIEMCVCAQLTLLALVDILGAVDTAIAARAGARERAVDGARVADRVLVAGIGRAGIVQMAEKT